jgi:hypothetical protein
MNKINCVMEYECPKSWETLTATKRTDIRFCNHCNKKVYLCASQEEIDAAATLKKCVAYDVHTNFENNHDVISKSITTKVIRRTIGLPKDYLNDGTKENFIKFLNSK